MNDDMTVSNIKKPDIEVPIPQNPDTNDVKEYIKNFPDYDDNFTIEMIIQKVLTDDKQYELSKIISRMSSRQRLMRDRSVPRVRRISFTLLPLRIFCLNSAWTPTLSRCSAA